MFGDCLQHAREGMQMFDDMKQRVHLGLGECYEGNATDDATAVGDDSLNDASKILGNDSTDHKLFLVERPMIVAGMKQVSRGMPSIS